MPAYNITFPSHNTGGSFGSFDEKSAGAWRSGSLSSQKQGLGFGRKAEMAAAEQGQYSCPVCQSAPLVTDMHTPYTGYIVREPEESVPPYAAKPASRFSHGSAASESEYTEKGGHSRPASMHEHARANTASPTTNCSETVV